MAVNMDFLEKNAILYKQTNFASLYKCKDRLFKVMLNERVFWRNNILNQIQKNHEITPLVCEDIILPLDLVVDSNNKVVGYEQRYINGYDLHNALKKNIPLERKIEIINYLFKLLEEVHNYLIVSDVRLSNCMIKKDSSDSKGFLIDLDTAILANESKFTISTYSIKKNDNSYLRTSKLEDITKMFIVAISFLSNYNFEVSFITSNSLEKLKKMMEDNMFPDDLIEYFFYLYNAINNDSKNIEYLEIPNSGSFLDKQMEKSIVLTRKKIKEYNL